jgi:DNA-binding GntR family transcriptional regulator
MIPFISPEESRRLEPFLPFGLASGPEADSIARVQGEFKRMLLALKLHPGHKVPLDTLAASLGLSRTPVREAMRLLETEGLVTALPNRGFQVREIHADETAQLYEARSCLERYLAAQALERRDERFMREMRDLQALYERVLSDSPTRRRLGMLADKAFHLRIAQQAGNAFLADVLGNIFDRLIFTRPLEGFPLTRMNEALEEHREILAAMRAGSAGKVRTAVMANVRNGGNSIIKYMREREAMRIAI